MIIEMARVRLLGPRARLPETLGVIQDVGALHITPAAHPTGLEALPSSSRESRFRRNLIRIATDAEVAAGDLESLAASESRAGGGPGYPAMAREANRARRQVAGIRARIATLEEERALIAKYSAFIRALEALGPAPGSAPNVAAFQLLLRADAAHDLGPLEQALEEAIGPGFTLRSEVIEGGETALLLLVPLSRSEQVEQLLAKTRVQQIPVPPAYGGGSLLEAAPRMRERAAKIPGEIDRLVGERQELTRREGPRLQAIRAAVADELARSDARAQSAVTAHAFILEGWLPRRTVPTLTERLTSRLGPDIVLEEIGKEDWPVDPAPVVLANPRLFRPFEAITGMLPLPSYGSIDPTPFVAVFFPMFFGIMVGDLGYGAAIAGVSWLLHRRSAPDTMLRSVSEIGGACALFTLIFGALYGELFGNLGHDWLGLHPLLFDRGEAVVPFLILAVSLGAIHVLIGLTLGMVAAARHDRRHAIGRGLSLVAVIAIIVAILAAVGVLPKAILSPATIGLLIVFPILIVVEGVVAPIEILSTLGHILSYARIMALGTASVMLAVVANRMAGAFGSVLIGALFALLFHLVNFALALFSPTIHALRLHYVEFFGEFYSPGGIRYQPLHHWRPSEPSAPAKP